MCRSPNSSTNLAVADGTRSVPATFVGNVILRLPRHDLRRCGRPPVIASVSFQRSDDMPRTLGLHGAGLVSELWQDEANVIISEPMSHCRHVCPVPACWLACTPVSLGRAVSSGGDNSAKFSGPSLRREFTRRLVLISLNAHASGGKWLTRRMDAPSVRACPNEPGHPRWKTPRNPACSRTRESSDD